jgi:hypothetical protein
LQQNGLIQIDGRRITICDEQALEVFPGDEIFSETKLVNLFAPLFSPPFHSDGS